MVDISIIVPVYNVELYLDRCIKSLVNQTYKNIEIILVNDGSTDKSGIICDEYCSKFENIKVIHKKNGGLSDARNYGLKMASGKYILFVDSDDYINEDSCERFAEYMNLDLEVLIGDVTKKIKNNSILMVHQLDLLNIQTTGKEFLKNELKKTGEIGIEAWRNLYLKEFLIKNNLFFKKGILHEDEQWTPRVLLLAERVMYTGINFYYYIIRENSITQSKKKYKNAIDLINTCYELETIFKVIEDQELNKLLNNYILKNYLGAIYMGKLYKNEYKSYLNDNFVYGKALCKKNRVKVILYNLNKFILYNALHLNQILDRYKRGIKNV